jgi:NADH:ubiquinone oxidoreductase subunit
VDILTSGFSRWFRAWGWWGGRAPKMKFMDRAPCIAYIGVMSMKTADNKVTLSQLGGIGGLLRLPGLVLYTLRRGSHVGKDEFGNQYYQQRVVAHGKRARRWVMYKGVPDASSIGPEWHSWLHHLTDNPLPDTGRKPWQKPHQANLTGTPAGYRPAGHDYAGGQRARASADYESWTPEG